MGDGSSERHLVRSAVLPCNAAAGSSGMQKGMMILHGVELDCSFHIPLALQWNNVHFSPGSLSQVLFPKTY